MELFTPKRLHRHRTLTACATLLLVLAHSRYIAAETAPDAPQSSAEAELLATTPRVWIFMGLPGDEERLQQYSETVDKLRDALTERFSVATEDLVILFGAGNAATYPECTKQGLLEELAAIREAPDDGRPIWLFFLGHSTSAGDRVHFNVAGRDPSIVDIARGLRDVTPRAGMVIFLTTAAAGKYVRPLAGPDRILVAATDPTAADNETEFPHVLASLLGEHAEDSDADGCLSVLELFEQLGPWIQAAYERDGFVQTERPCLDGNGDGLASAHPDDSEAAPARDARLRFQP